MASVHATRVRQVLKDAKGLFSFQPVLEDGLDQLPSGKGSIVYWMSRDQRAEDNWALLYARELANQKSVPVSVVFNLVPKFLEATERQYDFMLRGLEETETNLREKLIPFYLLSGLPEDTIPAFLKEHDALALVTDFSPLRTPREWVHNVTEKMTDTTPVFIVDAHNVVPVWQASVKQEYAARTIRPRITRQLPEYLVDFPELEKNSSTKASLPDRVDWKKANASLEIDRTLKAVDWIQPGRKAGMKMLQTFCTDKLKDYNTLRNKPTEKMLSNLSPYFHFGQIAPQRAILDVSALAEKKGTSAACKESAKSFVEETLIRRELSDNYCYYQKKYDSIDGTSDWAKKTLQDHEEDPRSFVYTLEQFENARTHSPFWNAMQLQLIREGKLHGFCRMMWAKNILEWSASPAEALRIAIYLNDRFNLDGRDPNGYVGCMWSICGLHDQGWKERNVFGKVRYMNEAGCKRKFDVAKFIREYSHAPSTDTKKRNLSAYFAPSPPKKKTKTK